VWAAGGIEVLGVSEDVTGRALDLQSHIRSSFYYLVSSIRADWAYGALNPGGLASDNYDTVFFDMEFYMQPALLWFWPPLARTMTEFRFKGLDEAKRSAAVFGYKGAQFPWCATSFGHTLAIHSCTITYCAHTLIHSYTIIHHTVTTTHHHTALPQVRYQLWPLCRLLFRPRFQRALSGAAHHARCRVRNAAVLSLDRR
jgi:hypothetical protein